jgi:hypothetical protein
VCLKKCARKVLAPPKKYTSHHKFSKRKKLSTTIFIINSAIENTKGFFFQVVVDVDSESQKQSSTTKATRYKLIMDYNL